MEISHGRLHTDKALGHREEGPLHAEGGERAAADGLAPELVYESILNAPEYTSLVEVFEQRLGLSGRAFSGGLS